MKRASLALILLLSCSEAAREQARLQEELQEKIRTKLAEAESVDPSAAPSAGAESGEAGEPGKPSPPIPVLGELHVSKTPGGEEGAGAEDERAAPEELVRRLSRTGAVDVRVTDGQGAKLTARVRLVHSLLGIIGREEGLDGFVCSGRARKRVPAGTVNVIVTAGHRRLPFWNSVGVLKGRTAKVRASLPLRPDLQLERSGWHPISLSHPGAGDPTRNARAEGVPLVLAPGGARRSNGAARAGNCVYGDLLLIGSRAEAVGLLSRGLERPNFIVLREARRADAASVLLHPTREVRLDPAEAAATRPFLRGYCDDASVQLAGLAAELPFDSVAGVMPDALDLSSPGAEELWFLLLNRGHRLCAVLAGGRERRLALTYVQTRVLPNPQNAARAIRAGRSMPTEGPLVSMLVGEAGAGETLRADGSVRSLSVAAHADCWSEGLKKIEIIRNGKVLLSTSCHMDKCHLFRRAVREAERAWYVVRVTAVSNRWHPLGAGKEIRAWAGPVYFSLRPRASLPPLTHVEGELLGGQTASVRARRGRAVFDETEAENGRFRLLCPPDSTIELVSEGRTRKDLLFEFLPARGMVRMIHADYWGLGARSLLDDRTYERMREACSRATVTFDLSPESGGDSQ